MLWSLQQEIRGRSNAQDPLAEQKKGHEEPVTMKSLFCYDLGGKETSGTFSAVIKSQKHKM